MQRSDVARLREDARTSSPGISDPGDLAERLVEAAMRLCRSSVPSAGGFTIPASSTAVSWSVATLAGPGGIPVVMAKASVGVGAGDASSKQALRRLESELRVRGLGEVAPLVSADGFVVGAIGRSRQLGIPRDVEFLLSWILARGVSAASRPDEEALAPSWIDAALGLTGSSVWWMASPDRVVEYTTTPAPATGLVRSSIDACLDPDEIVHAVTTSLREPTRATIESGPDEHGNRQRSKRHAVAVFDDCGMRGILVLVQPVVAPLPMPSVAAAERLGELVDRLDRIVRPASAGQTLHQEVEQWSRSIASPPLSGREIEIVMMLTQGFRTPSIARASFISPHTVRNHLKSIYAKLGLRSQGAVVDAFHTRRGANDRLEFDDWSIDGSDMRKSS